MPCYWAVIAFHGIGTTASSVCPQRRRSTRVNAPGTRNPVLLAGMPPHIHAGKARPGGAKWGWSISGPGSCPASASPAPGGRQRASFSNGGPENVDADVQAGGNQAGGISLTRVPKPVTSIAALGLQSYVPRCKYPALRRARVRASRFNLIPDPHQRE